MKQSLRLAWGMHSVNCFFGFTKDNRWIQELQVSMNQILVYIIKVTISFFCKAAGFKQLSYAAHLKAHQLYVKKSST